MDTVDILIMGRNTYEKRLTFGPWPYEKPVIVLSRNPIDIPTELTTITHSSETRKPCTPDSPLKEPNASISTAASLSNASSPQV